jgi:hypothetical protein
MIRLSWIIRNWRPQESSASSKDYYYKQGSFSQRKHWEVQISKFACTRNLLELTLDLGWTGEDHAGPELIIEVFGHWFNMKMYDSRHWDYELGQWEEYPGAVDERDDDDWGDDDDIADDAQRMLDKLEARRIENNRRVLLGLGPIDDA